MEITLNDGASEKLVLTTGGQLVTDRYGLSTARAVYWYFGPSPESQLSLFSAHPRWAHMALDKRTITRREDGAWDIAADYYGVDGTPDPVYSLDISTSQEPIETHEKFVSTLAGTAASPKNSAVFDDDDKTFVGFSTGQYAGVRGYLSPGAVWRSTWVTLVPPWDLYYIGRIQSPEGDPPTASGRDWLFTSLSYEQKGRTYIVRREWTLSGRKGWDNSIY